MIFIDMDGVLSDFYRGCIELTGKTPAEWDAIEKDTALWDAFEAARHKSTHPYLDLFPCRGARLMLEGVVELGKEFNEHVCILTALPPWRPHEVRMDKTAWMQLHFSEFNLPIQFCDSSKTKHLHCIPGDVLLDDFSKNITRWQGAGGIGIWVDPDADNPVVEPLAILRHHLELEYS